MQEEILLKKYRTGTTITYFSSKITEKNYQVSSEPALLYMNNFNIPTDLVIMSEFVTDTSTTYSDGIEVWRIADNDNIYKLKDVMLGGTIISGRTFTTTIEYTLSNQEENTFRDKFSNAMFELFSGASEDFVFFNKTEIDDFEITIKLDRTFDTLDTLNTYNKIYGEFPRRTAKTGVVFGRITAKQKIKDQEGNYIRIPLRNIPVGIFNPSERFPTLSSLDSEGNRMRLYFSDEENGNEQDKYSNFSSYQIDKPFLLNKVSYLMQDDRQYVLDYPEEFKYFTTTNDEGEFILQDIPVGAQTLVFEANLLQQGLSKEEVALNFFPYRGSNIVNIDEIPHYFFRQIPIDVVPAWGDLQTGYTETNVVVNLDLRKWATFYFSPTGNRLKEKNEAFFNNNGTLRHERDKGQKITDKTYYQDPSTGIYSQQSKDVYFKLGDPYFNSQYSDPLSIEIRDMTRYLDKNNSKDSNSTRNIQLVEIEDIMNRNNINFPEWVNEFSQIKNKATFKTFGYHVIKLPANLYDANGFRTNGAGEISFNTFNKGVWLASYQFNMYHIYKTDAYRTTGYVNFSNNSNGDHFYLNSNQNGICPTNTIGSQSAGSGIGAYPFEKNWTINYPNKYSIPKKPSSAINTLSGQYDEDADAYKQVITQPTYSDGFLIRTGIGVLYENSTTNILSGYSGIGLEAFDGSSDANFNGVYQGIYYNTFLSSVAIKSLYLYEKTTAEFGRYANGYLQKKERYVNINGENQSYTETSYVKNGESFQRVECGHSYFSYPSGLPLIGDAKNFGFNCDYLCKKYATAAAECCRYRDDQTSFDDDFYYDFNQKLNSVFFDGGKNLALLLDNVSKDNLWSDNRGALSLYRIIDEEDEIIDNPWDIFHTFNDGEIIAPTLIVNSGIIRFQKGSVSNKRTLIKYENSNKSLMEYNAETPIVNCLADAYITITNQGLATVNVNINNQGGTNLTKAIQPGSSAKFYFHDFTAYMKFEINLPANAYKSVVSNQYTKFGGYKYKISFNEIKLPDDSSVEEMANYKTTIDMTTDKENDELDYKYIHQKLYNVKACGSTRDIYTYGMIFINSKSTPGQIYLEDAEISNQCSDGGGYAYI